MREPDRLHPFVLHRKKILSEVDIVVFHINRLVWTSANALPTEVAFWQVISYRKWHRWFERKNTFLEACDGRTILDKTIEWFAPLTVLGDFKN